MENTVRIGFGEQIRALREKLSLPLRKVAAALDIDPSSLSKIERGERSATKEMLPILANTFEVSEHDLLLAFLSDRVAYELLFEENPHEILRVAEQKIKYLKSKNYNQGDLNLR